MKNSGPLYAVCVETDAGFAPVVEVGLSLLGIETASWHDYESRIVRFEAFHESRALAAAQRETLASHLRRWARGETWSVKVRRIPAEDWQESWKRFFHAERVSERIVVKPSWETWRSRRGDSVIELDPGMSFGTGRHFTTRACLRFMDELSRRRRGGSFLDMGCGSGILSIAAVKLGFTRVTAVDNDPEAVRIARENMRRNGVLGDVRCYSRELSRFKPRAGFDVVAANLQADILTREAARVCRLSAGGPRARLILSGILREQFPGIVECYGRLGFMEIRRLTDGEWTSGCFRPAGQ